MMRRINFFAKPKIQAKYVLITLILVLVTGLLSLYVMQTRIYHSEIAENLSTGEVQALIAEVRAGIYWVIGIVFIMSLIQAILFFHRLIGPVVALERILDLMIEGNFGGSVKLRKHDELKDLAEKIEKLGKRINEEIKQDKERIAQIKQKIELLKEKLPPQEYEGLREKLNELLDYFKEKE